MYTTGASPFKEEILKEVYDKNFSPEEQKNIKFYYLRGGFDFNKLDFFNKILMTMLKWKILLKPKGKRTPEEKGMLEAYKKPMDFTKKENITEIVNYIKLLEKENEIYSENTHLIKYRIDKIINLLERIKNAKIPVSQESDINFEIRNIESKLENITVKLER